MIEWLRIKWCCWFHTRKHWRFIKVDDRRDNMGCLKCGKTWYRSYLIWDDEYFDLYRNQPEDRFWRLGTWR